jgi:hypothetical protein
MHHRQPACYVCFLARVTRARKYTILFASTALFHAAAASVIAMCSSGSSVLRAVSCICHSHSQWLPNWAAVEASRGLCRVAGSTGSSGAARLASAELHVTEAIATVVDSNQFGQLHFGPCWGCTKVVKGDQRFLS